VSCLAAHSARKLIQLEPVSIVFSLTSFILSSCPSQLPTRFVSVPVVIICAEANRWRRLCFWISWFVEG